MSIGSMFIQVHADSGNLPAELEPKLQSAGEEAGKAMASEIDGAAKHVQQTLAETGTAGANSLREPLSDRGVFNTMNSNAKAALGELSDTAETSGHAAGTNLGSGLHDGARTGLSNVEGEVKSGLGRVEEETSKSGGRAGGGFMSGMRTRVSTGMGSLRTSVSGQFKEMAAAAAALFAVDKVKDFLGDSISEARESQKVGAQTAQVIKSTGGAADITAGQVGNLAGAISNYAGIDDEAIQSGENMLLTFTNVRNEQGKGNDIFNQATKIMTDLSVATGTSMKGASIQLGKALNDPVKGMAALSRVGVTFDAQQQQQIKTMVASGNTLGAQKMILRELGKEFGGSAAAQATAGEKLSVAWGNLKEQVGTALIPILDKLEGVLNNDVVPALSHTIGFLQNHSTAVKVVAAAVGALLTVWVAAKIGLAAYNTVQGISAVLSGEAAAATGLQTIALGAQRIASAAATAQAILLNAAMDANPILLVVVAIAALAAGIIIAWKHSETFREIVTGAFHAVTTAVQAVVGFFTTTLPNAISGLVGVVTTVFSNVVNFLRRWAPLILTVLVPFIGIPLLIWQHFSKIKDFLARAWDAAYSTVRSWIGRVVDFVKGLPGKIMDALQSLAARERAFFTAVWNTVKNVVQAGVSAVVSFVASLPGKALNALQSLGGRLRGLFSSAWSSASETVQNGVNRIVGYVSSLPGKIFGLAGRVASAAAHMIGGFWQGIKSGIGDVGGFVEDIGGAIRNGINSFLHLPIHIPTINTHIPGVGTVGGETLIPALAKGGLVGGNGRPTADDQIIAASSGEFVVNAIDTAKNIGLLTAINNGLGLAGEYARGGRIDRGGRRRHDVRVVGGDTYGHRQGYAGGRDDPGQRRKQYDGVLTLGSVGGSGGSSGARDGGGSKILHDRIGDISTGGTGRKVSTGGDNTTSSDDVVRLNKEAMDLLRSIDQHLAPLVELRLLDTYLVTATRALKTTQHLAAALEQVGG